jgi:hypothetical protein
MGQSHVDALWVVNSTEWFLCRNHMIICCAITQSIIQSLFSSIIKSVYHACILYIQPNSLLLRILPCRYALILFSFFLSRTNEVSSMQSKGIPRDFLITINQAVDLNVPTDLQEATPYLYKSNEDGCSLHIPSRGLKHRSASLNLSE